VDLKPSALFGQDLGSISGKIVQRTPDQVKLNDYEIPTHILENYGNVAIGIDIMFINQMPFLLTIPRNIKFCTRKMIKVQNQLLPYRL
jgi:hypothetical protein